MSAYPVCDRCKVELAAHGDTAAGQACDVGAALADLGHAFMAGLGIDYIEQRKRRNLELSALLGVDYRTRNPQLHAQLRAARLRVLTETGR